MFYSHGCCRRVENFGDSKGFPGGNVCLADRPAGTRFKSREVRMPDYRRFRVPGGTYFFTVNLLEQRLDTLVQHIDVLREAVRMTKRE